MTIIEIVLLIGSIAGALLAIWALLSRSTTKFEQKVREVVKEEIEESRKQQSRELNIKLEAQSELILKDVDGIGAKLDKHIKEHNELHKQKETKESLLANAMIESYKQDIRNAYFKLRETGEITDKDKAYVDKIYPYYAALGGNSDIHSKYKEISDVYAEVTKENYEAKRKSRRKTTTTSTQQKETKVESVE